MADIKVLFNNLDTIHYEELNIPEILAQRDEACFNDNWVRIYVQVQVIKQQMKYPAGRTQISDTYRKRSFQKVYKYTSDMGLSLEVSEDMSLIYDGLVIKYEDEWFKKLVASYERAIIPYGELE